MEPQACAAPTAADRVRALARRRFVWRAGVLGWALPVAVFSTFGTQLLKWTGLIETETVLDFGVWLFRTAPVWGTFAALAYVGLWVVGGVVMGHYLWRRHARRMARRGRW